jgi:hypothetical protein
VRESRAPDVEAIEKFLAASHEDAADGKCNALQDVLWYLEQVKEPAEPRRIDGLRNKVTESGFMLSCPAFEEKEFTIDHLTRNRDQDNIEAKDVIEVASAVDPRFETAAFQCVGDFERCKRFYGVQGSGLSERWGCSVIFLICIGQQIIPFAGE